MQLIHKITMKPVVSAGILIKDTNTKKYLLVNPNGGTTGGWGIPKGKKDPGESLLDAALREVREETGVDLKAAHSATDNFNPGFDLYPFFHYVVETREKGEKKFKKHVYIFRGTVINSNKIKLNCTSFLENGKPEVAEFGWFTLEECFDLVVKSQKPLFKYLLDYEAHNAL